MALKNWSLDPKILLLAQGSCMLSLVYELVGKTLPTSHFPLLMPLAHLTSDFKRFLHFYPRCHAVLWWPILGTEKAGKWPAVVRWQGAEGGSGCWWLEAAWLVNWLMHYIIKMYDFSLRNSKSVLGQSKQREKNVDSLMFSQAYVVKF